MLVTALHAPLWQRWWQQIVFQILHLSHGALPHRVLLWPQHHELSDFAATYCFPHVSLEQSAPCNALFDCWMCCRCMQSSGAIYRYRHFRFKNSPIVEGGGDFWVMGRSWAYIGGNVNTLERNPLAAVNRGIAHRIAVDMQSPGAVDRFCHFEFKNPSKNGGGL